MKNHFLKKKKNSIIRKTISLLIVVFIFSLVIFGGFYITYDTSLFSKAKRAKFSEFGDFSCSNLTLSPNKRVFTEGERVQISYRNDNLPYAVTVWVADASVNIEHNSWVQVPGSYNSQTGVFRGKWTVPQEGNKEYVIVVNEQSKENGPICSGNPKYLGINQGVLVGGGYSLDQPQTCAGCGTSVAVVARGQAENTDKSGFFDMKTFWSVDPGDYWVYDGVNTSYSPNRKFKTRIEAEQPMEYCGRLASPLLFLKDDPAGYWGPVYSWSEN